MAQLLWYIRHEDKTMGPFPQPQVEDMLRGGELSEDWEISLDERDWLCIRESGHFSKERLARQQAQAAERKAWAEQRQLARERLRCDTHDAPQAHDEQLDAARRQALGQDAARTAHLLAAARNRRPSFLIIVLAFLALVGVGITVWWGGRTQPIQASLGQPVNCAAAAAEGVNWSGCDKRAAALAGALLRNARLDAARLEEARLAGALLEYASAKNADLRNADLRGAKLVGADLAGADLAGADLAGANLRHAVLDAARLTGTRLDHAVWTDGRACAPGSIGACL